MTDKVRVKIYRLKDKDGQVYKEGAVFEFTQEMFMRVAEGCEYPIRRMEEADRFEGFIEELENE